MLPGFFIHPLIAKYHITIIIINIQETAAPFFGTIFPFLPCTKNDFYEKDNSNFR